MARGDTCGTYTTGASTDYYQIELGHGNPSKAGQNHSGHRIAQEKVNSMLPELCLS
jgi:hypothetical protein